MIMQNEFSKERYEEWLAVYKGSFEGQRWEDERYKWVAARQFQDSWDIDAEDFPAMLEKSLSKTGNLLVSAGTFPKGMITQFAHIAPEEIRAMFRELFDESRDVIERIEEFKHKAEALHSKYRPDAGNHYQSENAISTYLWLRYPDKYYIYKLGEVKAVAAALGSDLVFKKGRYEDNLRNFYRLYDSIHDELIKDAGLRKILERSIDQDCYPDLEGRTLTFDFGFFVSRTSRESTEPKHLSEETSRSGDEKRCVWWLNANPRIWSFAETPVGEVQTYTLFNESGNKRRIFQNFLDAKPGDIVIGYESNPVKQIVALGEIVEGSDGERIAFKKTETLATPVDYQDLKAMPELESMEFFVNPNGSLFKVEPEEYEAIIDAIRELNPAVQTEEMEPYDRESFLSEVFVAPSEYDKLARVLRKSKNIILQGAPGTGKTFAARRLAYAMMGSKDDARIRLVQFHQNYSYEDFVMGYKPEGDTFKLKNGVFYEFCKMAESHPDLEYFFIIDEINRGNMSKVFGELLMLIEASHRGDYATLAYNGLSFTVPENLYIIGMMNTADRSLAMIDYALRRRFAFYEMEPAFDAQGFLSAVSDSDSPQLRNLIEVMRDLNKEIESDASLGRGFRIGHSYFCGMESGSAEELRDMVDLEIVPMLEEYWFDDGERVSAWRDRLEGAIR